MKIFALFASILCAIALSVAVALFALRETEPQTDPDTPIAATSESLQLSLFPEQHRAVDTLMEEIVARQKKLDRQELLLSEREARVHQDEIVLMRMRDELTATKQALEEQFQAIDSEDKVNTRKLAEFYARMDAENAATLLMELDRAQAARILNNLQDRQAGAILTAAVAMGGNGIELAAIWSEEIRRIRNQKQ